MSYHNQPQGYGGPPQGHSPQPGYPPQGHGPPPTQYPNQQPMYNQQQPGYPPHGQQQWGQPPPQHQGQWGQQPPYSQPPQQQQWSHGPPLPQGHYNQPPPQQYGQQQYGAPPPQQHGGWGAPQPGYGPPPPQQGYGAQVGSSSSHQSFLSRAKRGVQALTAELKGPQPSYGEPTARRGEDPRSDAIRVHKAIDGMGTDEKELSLTLAAVQQPYQMAALRQAYDGMFAHQTTVSGTRKDFIKAIEGDVSGSYGELCGLLARPAAEQDAYFVHQAVSRPGTSEDLLNDILLGRTNREINEMKQAYRHLYQSDMRTDVANDLSMKTKDMFMLVLEERREEENAPCVPQNIQRDVADLKGGMRSSIGGLGKDTMGVVSILARRSNGQIRAINLEYERVHGKGSLEKDIKKKFSGHMEDALLLMLFRGIDPLKSEAMQLEQSMKGMGTNEALLTNRVVKVHWDKNQLGGVRAAYYHTYRKSLMDRIRGETSGNYEKLLIELTYPGVWEDPSKVKTYKDQEKR